MAEILTLDSRLSGNDSVDVPPLRLREYQGRHEAVARGIQTTVLKISAMDSARLILLILPSAARRYSALRRRVL